jgi:ABC-type nitrate/sulfonate/bicarbonate transport system substrate-binding protein
MQERGIDVGTAVDVGAALFQRSRGADLYIVGGWRYTSNLKFFGARHLRSLDELRGARIGIREDGDLQQIFITNALRKAGIAAGEVRWLYDPVFAYGNNPAHLDMLRSGKVDGMCSQPPYSNQLAAEGFPVLLDPQVLYPGGRPDKVVVATERTITQRGAELRAFLRANTRGFWFMRTNANYDYLRHLERRLREQSRNDQERRVSIITSIEKVEGWTVPPDGGVSRTALRAVIEELREVGELDHNIPVDEVLRDEAVLEAYRELEARRELAGSRATVAAAVEKYGF